MISLTRRARWMAAVAAAVVMAGVGWLVFGFFGFQTLFIDDEVAEELPTFDAAPSDPDPGSESDSAAEAGETTENPATDEPDAAPETGAEPVTEILTVVSGGFEARSHPGEGTAVVLSDGSAQRFLRFEDFATDNGPDLNVYLSAAPVDADAGDFDDDFVDLGDLKGNVGSQNYEIPADVDLDHYSTVVIWCVRFAVAFTVADLST